MGTIRAFIVGTLRPLLKEFLLRSPTELFFWGIGVSVVDYTLLYTAAARDGVLRINGGVGLFENYAIFSTLVGNAIAFCAAKMYYDAVRSMENSGAIVRIGPIRKALSRMDGMITMQGRYPFVVYGLAILGALFCLANAGIHLFGNPESWWGHKVFDSKDHLFSFFASRLHNLYTWVIIMPFTVHVMTCATFQLKSVMAKKAALKYDLLNPDQRGGFGFVERAHIAFNIVAALIYIQITMHILTFRLSVQHIIAYIGVTALLFVINRVFLGDVHTAIKRLRYIALDEVKNKVFNDDELSFEILKYCYQRSISTTRVAGFVIKAAAVVPGFVKLWPTIRSVFT